MARLRKEKKNLIIILNDNKMSFAENVGGMSAYLNKVRTRKEGVNAYEKDETVAGVSSCNRISKHQRDISVRHTYECQREQPGYQRV